MKKKTLKGILILFTISLFFSACDEREFDVPDYTVPKYTGPQATMTIAQFKTLSDSRLAVAGTGIVQMKDTIILKGVVVANDVSGNIYKQIQVQDETAGIAVLIDRNNIYGDYVVGQTVYINCTGLYVGYYGGYLQLGSNYQKTPGSNVKVGQLTWLEVQQKIQRDTLPNINNVKSDTIRIEQITPAHYGKLVTLKDVVFDEGGKAVFAEKGSDGSVQTVTHVIKSLNGRLKVDTRNSSASNFASFTLPEYTGMVTGVLSSFQSSVSSDSVAYQLTFRDSLDCSPRNFYDTGNGTELSPYVPQYVLTHQGSSIIGWIKGYIVGTVAPGITSNNQINGNEDIVFSGGDYMDNTVVIAASADERDWKKCIVVNLPSGSAMRDQVNLVGHSGNIGALLKVTGTLQNYFGAAGLNVATGSVNEFILGESIDGGDGSEAQPYDIPSARTHQGAALNNDFKWVTGYVVGVYETSGTTNVPSFAAPFTVTSNLILAPSATETNISKCIAVQLPVGATRDALSPAVSPSILGKKVKVQGSLEAYFSIPGVKNLQSYAIDGVTPVPSILNVPFDTDMGGFTEYSVIGSEVWVVDPTPTAKYVKMSGFVTVSSQNEDWLISPAINLTGKTSATLTFSHTINKGDVANKVTNHTLWVSTNYVSGAPSTATWTQVTIPTYPTGADWSFVGSGNIALPASLLGNSNARIAFKYLCSNTESASWEIRSLIVK